MPPRTLGVLWVKYLGFPGSARSGEKAKKKSSSGLRPAWTRRGSSTSRVKPGKVVLSRTTNWGRVMRATIISAASMMNELSGSFVLLSGVGTQMMIASASASTAGSLELDRLPARTSGPSFDEATSLIYETTLAIDGTFDSDLS